MKPVLKKEDRVDYISQGKMIDFIRKNSKMDPTECCDFCRENIFGEPKCYCEKADYFNDKKEKYYDPEHWKWIRMFYEAHPFLDTIMFVFDD